MTDSLAVFDYNALDVETRVVVQQKTGEIHERVDSIKRDFIEIGKRLTDVKARLPYGYWGAWLESEFGWSQDTATNLMNAAQLAGKIPNFSESGSQFAQTAMYVLGAKATPSEAVKEAVDRATHGEQITGAIAKQIVSNHKPPTTGRRSGVNFAGEGAEPDLDENGQPLTRQRDEEDDEFYYLGDVVDFRGHRCEVVAVSSSGRLSLKSGIGQPLHGVDQDEVTLIERAERRARVSAPPPTAPPAPAAAAPPPVRLEAIDGVLISESHPYSYKHLYHGYGVALCSTCGEIHPRWSAVRGAYWRCEMCKALIPDDAMELYGAEDAALENRVKQQNGRHKPKTNYAAPAEGADQRDQCQTPGYAVDPLLRYLTPDMRVWEPAYGEGLLAEALYDSGFKTVVTGDIVTGEDFFAYEPEEFDVLVTNPPFSGKYRWLERCYALGKPFALLMPLEVLGAKSAQCLFREHGVNVIFLSDRVDFKMPNLGWDGGGAQFPVAWFCWGLPIPEQMVFADIEEAKRAFKDGLRSAIS